MIKIYKLDSFTGDLFSGNPAAVCPLDNWISEEMMQKIAFENNLAETAFFVKEDDHFVIRWFTPAIEVDLCGHATLASAYVLFNHEGFSGDVITFLSPRSGILKVARKGDVLTLDFPADTLEKVDLTEELCAGFNIEPVEAYRGKTDHMLIFETQQQILDLVPDFIKIADSPGRGIIVTARGEDCDFVSRFFAPQSGINEDPVTGSAHTTLTPYWSEVLGKKELTAIQLSKRRGYLRCRNLGERIEISGQCRLFLEGRLYV